MKTAKQWLDLNGQEIARVFEQETDEECIKWIQRIQQDAFESGVIATRHARLDPSPEELWKEKILEQGFRHPQA